MEISFEENFTESREQFLEVEDSEVEHSGEYFD